MYAGDFPQDLSNPQRQPCPCQYRLVCFHSRPAECKKGCVGGGLKKLKEKYCSSSPKLPFWSVSSSIFFWNNPLLFFFCCCCTVPLNCLLLYFLSFSVPYFSYIPLKRCVKWEDSGFLHETDVTPRISQSKGGVATLHHIVAKANRSLKSSRENTDISRKIGDVNMVQKLSSELIF